MMMKFAFISVLLFVSAAIAASSAPSLLTVYYSNNAYTFKEGVMDQSGVAVAEFEDTLNTTGWGVLRVLTNNTYPDEVQMFAAGYAEGYLTSARIRETAEIVQDIFFQDKAIPDSVRAFMNAQESWTKSMVASNTSDYWRATGYVMEQYNGMIAGFNASSSTLSLPPLPHFAFQMLNGCGDFFDVLPAVEPSTFAVNYSSLSTDKLRRTLARAGHCSALIKVLPDFSDVLMSHSSWFEYGLTNRIYKHYNLQLQHPSISAKRTSFSSYPGFLESLDDFYLMDSGLAMLQTTNSILNSSLYEFIKPESLLAWQRVRVAGLLASSGRQWADAVTQYNSGTYNNQYMVLDLKRIEIGKQLHDGALWVIEQTPGYMESADVTSVLERGYWPSYNVPYFPTILNRSGYTSHGFGNEYQMAPRAQIFRRDQSNVNNLESLKYLMRYNDYKYDPLSHDNPGNAICSRFDLDSSPVPAGCYDTKVANYSMAKALLSEAINGPTYQGLEPFRWTEQFKNTTHSGDPEVYDFGFYVMDPAFQSPFSSIKLN